MARNIFLGVLLQAVVGSSYAYEVEQEGDSWYVYRGNELIGTYSHMSWPTSHIVMVVVILQKDFMRRNMLM